MQKQKRTPDANDRIRSVEGRWGVGGYGGWGLGGQ